MQATDGSSKDGATITLHARAGVTVPVDLGPLRSRIAAAVAECGRPVTRLHVELVDDAIMDHLHRKHSGVPGTTDVLTFPASGPDDPVDVDIVACVDEARRRAVEFGHDVERELLLYAVHGLLHCLGHDDHDPEAFERMHAEEDRILTAIGTGATFRPHHPDRHDDAMGAS